MNTKSLTTTAALGALLALPMRAGVRLGLIHGQISALLSHETASYISTLMGAESSVVELPSAQQHVRLDQPLAFVAALYAMLDRWNRDSASAADVCIGETRKRNP